MSRFFSHPATARSLRLVGALLVLLNGAVHLLLYVDEYHRVHIIGSLFLVNVAASLAIAIALVAKPEGAFAAAGLAFSVTTFAAFVLSRTAGLFGYREGDIDGKALLTLISEGATLAVLGLWFMNTKPRSGQLPVLGERVAADRAGSRDRRLIDSRSR